MEHNLKRVGNQSHPMVAKVVDSTNPTEGLLPVVMIHGGFHTGAAYMETPDGRPGWAQLFAQRGHSVVVPDWPGHGNSPGIENIAQLTSLAVARSMGSMVQEIGRCILLAHSASGPFAWWLAENYSEQIAAVIGVAPGSPANLLPILPEDPAALQELRWDAKAGFPVFSQLDQAVTVNETFIAQFWAQSQRFPRNHLEQYVATVVPESPRILNERFNIGGAGMKVVSADVVASRPILVVTGEHDPRHPRQVDGALADYFDADFYWLPAFGMLGNGHMLMLEDNSQEIAELLIDWLQSRGL